MNQINTKNQNQSHNQAQAAAPKSTATPKSVFSIVKDEKGEERWHKVGVAFVNKDDSTTILLDALPLGRKLQVREPKDFTGAEAGE